MNQLYSKYEPVSSIRRYVATNDYPIISSWYRDEAPSKEALPEDSTFIFELNDIPALSVTLYLTNCKEICMVEHFIGNPDLSGSDRRQATIALNNFISDFAKALGYKNLVAMTANVKLQNYYQGLGYKKVSGDLPVLKREI
jgi:hypothetical protein